MIAPALIPGIAVVASFVFTGLAFGLAYFAVLRRTVDLHSAGHGRFAILFLGVAARVGTLPLLSSFIGFLLARALALRAVRGAA
jgi:hypothetical protein